jgi:hypothetical protein
MKYSDLLRVIYSNDLSKIISVLNLSEYVTNFLPDDKSIVIHTGFVFTTHKAKLLELFYDIKNETLIRQIRLKKLALPQLNGLVANKDKRQYFNNSVGIVLTEIPQNDNNGIFYHLKSPRSYFDNENINEIKVIKDNKREYTLKSFNVKKGKTVKSKYPFYKTLTDLVFYDGHSFSRYVPANSENEEFDPYEDYDLDDVFNDATDGQLGDLGDDGWEYLGRR